MENSVLGFLTKKDMLNTNSLHFGLIKQRGPCETNYVRNTHTEATNFRRVRSQDKVITFKGP